MFPPCRRAAIIFQNYLPIPVLSTKLIYWNKRTVNITYVIISTPANFKKGNYKPSFGISWIGEKQLFFFVTIWFPRINKSLNRLLNPQQAPDIYLETCLKIT